MSGLTRRGTFGLTRWDAPGLTQVDLIDSTLEFPILKPTKLLVKKNALMHMSKANLPIALTWYLQSTFERRAVGVGGVGGEGSGAGKGAVLLLC